MDSLAIKVECVIPRVSPTGTRVVKALINSRGFVGGADAFAWAMGLRNRDQLRRILDADGLPCLEDLAGWIRILGWTLDAEGRGVRLGRSALAAEKDPRSYYRTVKRLTGKRWGEILILGSNWVLLQFAVAVGGANGAHSLYPMIEPQSTSPDAEPVESLTSEAEPRQQAI